MRVPIAFPKIPNLVYFEADFFSRRTHLVNQYINTLVHQYINTLVHQYISTSVHQYISTSVHQYIGKSVHHNNVTSPFRKMVVPVGSRFSYLP